jgi:NAD(P)-dependent dehydrogenase (short-subunit alcohol dehydrogenase family)
MTDQRSGIQLEDPRALGEKPPYPEQGQPVPGTETEMQPKPDHGEQSYVGKGLLKDRVALITGADSGIGKAVALAYAREGADIVVSYLNESEDARETIRLVEAEGRRGLDAPGDVSGEEHCRSLIDRTVSELGRIDILVNNAAQQARRKSIEEVSSEEFERIMRVNVFAYFYLCKAAIPHMPPGSAIINTSSIQAFQPSAELLSYATSKGAEVTFSKALAQLVAPRGIRVNVVAPGPVWTPLIPATPGADGQQAAKFGQESPFGRPAQPKELAPVYVLLASEEGSYISGAVYGVTGGQPIPG